MGLWTLHGVYRERLTPVTLIGRAQPWVRAQPELSPATARLTGSPFGSRSTADRTFAPFREFPAFGHSAAALTIESRDSLIDVQGRAGWADRSALPASFCQAVPPLLCDCSQSTAQRELLSPRGFRLLCLLSPLHHTQFAIAPLPLVPPLSSRPPAVQRSRRTGPAPRRCRSVPSCRSAPRCQRSADEQSRCRRRSQGPFRRHALSLLSTPPTSAASAAWPRPSSLALPARCSRWPPVRRERLRHRPFDAAGSGCERDRRRSLIVRVLVVRSSAVASAARRAHGR